MRIPKELAPYFECCFILAFSICENCGESVQFKSDHPQFSDGWWLDEASAMKALGWVVPKNQEAYCQECAKKLNVKHDETAYTIETSDF